MLNLVLPYTLRLHADRDRSKVSRPLGRLILATFGFLFLERKKRREGEVYDEVR